MRIPSITQRISLLIPLALIFLSACKKDPSGDYEQNRIYVDYQLECDEENNSSEVQVEFHLDKKNGKRLYLSEDARLFFNGTEVLERSPEHGNYKLDIDSLVLVGEFVYVNTDGDSFRNHIDVHTIGVPSFYDNLNIGYRNDVYWVGSALNPDEEISFVLYEDWSMSSVKTISNETGNPIVLGSNDLMNIEPGSYRFRLSRTWDNDHINSDPVGGRLRSIYHSRLWPISLW